MRFSLIALIVALPAVLAQDPSSSEEEMFSILPIDLPPANTTNPPTSRPPPSTSSPPTSSPPTFTNTTTSSEPSSRSSASRPGPVTRTSIVTPPGASSTDGSGDDAGPSPDPSTVNGSPAIYGSASIVGAIIAMAGVALAL